MCENIITRLRLGLNNEVDFMDNYMINRSLLGDTNLSSRVENI